MKWAYLTYPPATLMKKVGFMTVYNQYVLTLSYIEYHRKCINETLGKRDISDLYSFKSVITNGSYLLNYVKKSKYK